MCEPRMARSLVLTGAVLLCSGRGPRNTIGIFLESLGSIKSGALFQWLWYDIHQNLVVIEVAFQTAPAPAPELLLYAAVCSKVLPVGSLS